MLKVCKPVYSILEFSCTYNYILHTNSQITFELPEIMGGLKAKTLANVL